MKRLIMNYTVNPGMLDEFKRASTEFAAHTKEQDTGIIEFTICTSENTVTHYISFADEHAKHAHTKAPRTQVFEKLADTLCSKEPTEIELPEHNLKTGVCGVSLEQEQREQEQISLHKNQDEIEQISK
jgi:quinol monooxygenase YgiN